MSFFDELKRINVFRVGIAYGVAAWVLLQVVDLVVRSHLVPKRDEDDRAGAVLDHRTGQDLGIQRRPFGPHLGQIELDRDAD